MTAALMRGQDLIGHPVVALSTGDDLAEIKDIVFDAERGQITGFTLRKRSFFGRTLKDVLPVDGVSSVGTHAVMVENEESLVAPDEAHAESVARGDDVLTNAVITESGRTLGTVQDVIVVGGTTPRVVGFEIGGGTVGNGLIPLAAKQGVSGSALIVPDDFEQRVRTDLTGLAAELTDIDGESSMILLSQLIGQQAVSLATAEKTGRVKGIVLDGNRVAGVQIDDVTIPADAVRSFEGDVLTYDSAVKTTERAGMNPIGRLVLDHFGDGIGAIHDLQLGVDGTVEMVILDSGDQVDGSRLEAVGNFAAIIGSEFPPPTDARAA